MSDDGTGNKEINDYLDGRLGEAARAAFEERMRRDPALAREAAELRAIGSAIREAAGPGDVAGEGLGARAGVPSLGDDFYARAREQFESEAKVVEIDAARIGARRGFRIPWAAVGVAAACVILVAIFLPEGRITAPPVARRESARDMALPVPESGAAPAEDPGYIDKLGVTAGGTAAGMAAGTPGGQTGTPAEFKDEDRRTGATPSNEAQKENRVFSKARPGSSLPNPADEEFNRLRAAGYVGERDDKAAPAAAPPPASLPPPSAPAAKIPSNQPPAAGPAAPAISGGAVAARSDTETAADAMAAGNSVGANEPSRPIGDLAKARGEAQATEGTASLDRKKTDTAPPSLSIVDGPEAAEWNTLLATASGARLAARLGPDWSKERTVFARGVGASVCSGARLGIGGGTLILHFGAVTDSPAPGNSPRMAAYWEGGAACLVVIPREPRTVELSTTE